MHSWWSATKKAKLEELATAAPAPAEPSSSTAAPAEVAAVTDATPAAEAPFQPARVLPGCTTGDTTCSEPTEDGADSMLVDGVSSLSMTAQLTGGKRDAVPMPELGMGRGKRVRSPATKDGGS